MDEHAPLALDAGNRAAAWRLIAPLAVATRGGDGTIGWSEHAPYDGIVVTAGAPSVPETLLHQLADGGKFVIPVGDLEIQRLVVVSRFGEQFERREMAGFKFVPLIGKMGW